MYALGFLLAGVLLLVLLSPREHLTISPPMVDIRDTAPPAEQDRIFAMAPTSLQTRAAATNTAMGNPIDRTKSYVAGIIRDFQLDIYVAATAPITEAVITTWVASRKAMYQQARESPLTTFYLDAYSNGDAKRLVMAYVGLTATATTPPVNPPPASSTVPTPTSIPQALQYLQDNLLEYKMTGNATYKTAYEGTKRWIDNYIASLNTQIARDADGIVSTIASHESANPELAKSQADFQALRTNGPKVEDTYLTIKKQMDHQTGADAPSSDTSTYVKGGIVVGLVIGALVLVLL
jgi:hypothetical protein